MSGWPAIRVVARREIVERARSKAFRISSALLLAVAIGGAIVASAVGGGTTSYDVGLVGAQAQAVGLTLSAQGRAAGAPVRLHDEPTEAAARAAVRAGNLDVAIVGGTRILVKDDRTSDAARLATAAIASLRRTEALRAAGISPATARRILLPAVPPVVAVAPKQISHTDQGIVGAGVLVLYLALLVYAQWTANGVVEEKSSRIVEVLLPAVAPRNLLAGKVLGLGALGISQLVVVGGAALITGVLAAGSRLPSAAPAAFGLLVLWFVLGFALYSAAYGLAGSLVSRQEDVPAVTAPMTLIVVAAYIVAANSLSNPDSGLATVASFIPPFAPMVVPTRIILGTMSPLGLVISIALTLVAIVIVVRLAAVVYERAVLQTGGRVRLREVLRSA